MRHDLIESVATMLTPDALSALVEQPITHVTLTPLSGPGGATGSSLARIETNGGLGPQLVLKRFSVGANWAMRATRDHQGRETLLWREGLLDRFPPEVMRCVIACARDGEGWAILMHDVSEVLLPEAPFDVPTNDLLLEALAALHAAFWEQTNVIAPVAGFCTPWRYYTSLSEPVARRETRHSDDFPAAVVRGWELVSHVVDPGVAQTTRRLACDPSPLCRALDRYPQTLAHRDLNRGNVGVLPGPTRQVVLLDWQFAGPAPPGADLAGYLSEFAALLPISKEATIQRYRRTLEQQLGCNVDEGWWHPQLALSLLGEWLRLAWAYALHVSEEQDAGRRAWWLAELAWWSEQFRGGLQYL